MIPVNSHTFGHWRNVTTVFQSLPPGVTRGATAGLCSNCTLRELCGPSGLMESDTICMGELIRSRKSLKRGQTLYREGEPFRSLYAVRSGFFKSNLQLEDGREQVTGFHMTGELIGMDGIDSGAYTSSATSLEDSEVCEVSYGHFVNLSEDVHCLLPRFHRLMSREILRVHGMMLLLGSMTAEERLTVFLLDLSQRYRINGYSASEFILRMSRDEISSYLGLRLETVSRAFSKLQSDGLIDVHHRQIRIRDISRLKRHHRSG